MVALTTLSNPTPAAARTAPRFSITRSVCARMSPGTNCCVAGSSGICPLVKMKSPSEMACEYGPIAFGAFSVEITLMLLHPHAALPVGVALAVLVGAEQSAGLVLPGADAALELAVDGLDLATVLDVADAVGATSQRQRRRQEKNQSLFHTRSTECTPGMFPIA